MRSGMGAKFTKNSTAKEENCDSLCPRRNISVLGPSVRPSVHQSVLPSVILSFRLSVGPSIHPSYPPHMCPSVRPSLGSHIIPSFRPCVSQAIPFPRPLGTIWCFVPHVERSIARCLHCSVSPPFPLRPVGRGCRMKLMGKKIQARLGKKNSRPTKWTTAKWKIGKKTQSSQKKKYDTLQGSCVPRKWNPSLPQFITKLYSMKKINNPNKSAHQNKFLWVDMFGNAKLASVFMICN